MKKNTFKMLSLLLTLVLIFGMALPASAASNTAATTLRLVEQSGTVTIKNASGKAVTAKKDMRLYSGYTIKTGANSSAFISLDGEKAVKLDAETLVEVIKSGKKLEVSLASGNLFFSVAAPLKSDESMNIRTSNMVCGIRGSFGWVNPREVGLIHGHAFVSCRNAVTGEMRTTELISGQLVRYMPEGGTHVDEQLREIDFDKTPVENDDIPAIAAEEIAADPEKQEQIREDVHTVDVDELVRSATGQTSAGERRTGGRKGGNTASEPEETYTVSVAAASNGTVAADKAKAAEGETVALTVTPDSGYEIDVLTVTAESGKAVTVTDNSFTMPASDVTIAATFKKLDQVASPTFTPAAGAYTGAQSVALTCATDGAAIYYTVDGSMPTTASMLYTDAISVENSMTIKAVAVKSGMLDSSVAEAAYRINVTVSFNAGEGTGTMDAAAVEKGKAYTLPANGFIPPTGKEFKVWSVGDAECAPDAEIKVSGDTVVTALWKFVDYTITAKNPEHGSLTVKVNNEEATSAHYGETVTLTVKSASGYELDALTVKDESGKAVTVTDKSFTMPASDVTIAATFKKLDQVASPTFTPAAGAYTGTQSVELSCATAGAAIYYTTDDSTPTTASMPYTGAISVGNSMTIKAIAVKSGMLDSSVAEAAYRINATISFDAGGGTGTMADVSVEKGKNYTLPANAFTPPTGKTFKAWSVGGKEYDPGASITVSSNTAVTALWKGETYGVMLNPNGGTITSGNVTSYEYGKGATLPTAVTRTGTVSGYTSSYTFLGWYDNASCTGSAVTEIETDDSGAKEYWALWSYNTGDFTVRGGTAGKDYTFSSPVLTIQNTGVALTLANQAGKSSTAHRIELASGDSNVSLTLAGVNIAAANGPALKIPDNFAPNVEIALAEGSTNTLATSNVASAALQKNSDVTLGTDDKGNETITVNGGTLTITGKGFLTAENTTKYSGGNDSRACGAGIGGEALHSTGMINITGGATVTARGGVRAAGIGGGRGKDNGENSAVRYGGHGVYITVSNGAEVTACGGNRGAGIGSGGGIDEYEAIVGAHITIENATVHAYGGGGELSGNTYSDAEYGAGIGTGINGACRYIKIINSDVTAYGGLNSSGIGSSQNGSGSTIEITDSTVTAYGGNSGAGIGGGRSGSGNDITITGSNVTATGGNFAAGIGGGIASSGSNITINDGTVHAYGGGSIGNQTNHGSGAGIGGGGAMYEDSSKKPAGDGTNIVIKGGTIVAHGGTLDQDGFAGAGIGGGGGLTHSECPGGVGDVHIHGGNVTARGGGDSTVAHYQYGGAGIGNGAFGSGGAVEISGGTVQAHGGPGAAGIGGGGITIQNSSTPQNTSCGKVTISGGEVHAYGGDGGNKGTLFGGAGIGGTFAKTGDTASITISGSSTVEATGGNAKDYCGAGIGGSGNYQSSGLTDLTITIFGYKYTCTDTRVGFSLATSYEPASRDDRDKDDSGNKIKTWTYSNGSGGKVEATCGTRTNSGSNLSQPVGKGHDS